MIFSESIGSRACLSAERIPAGICFRRESFFAGACTHTFTQDMTMEPMVDHCAQFMEEIKKQSGQNLTKEQAKEMMHRFSPNLKRWKK